MLRHKKWCSPHTPSAPQESLQKFFVSHAILMGSNRLFILQGDLIVNGLSMLPTTRDYPEFVFPFLWPLPEIQPIFCQETTFFSLKSVQLSLDMPFYPIGFHGWKNFHKPKQRLSFSLDVWLSRHREDLCPHGLFPPGIFFHLAIARLLRCQQILPVYLSSSFRQLNGISTFYFSL